MTHLPCILPAPTGDRPSNAGPDHPMRRVTRLAAFDPGGWDPARRSEVAAVFDGLASEWHTRATELRVDVVADALARGGPIPDGPWLELGSGTGLVTPTLAAAAPSIVAVDLSAAMLALAPPGVAPRVRADSASLPVASGSMAAVVLVNAFLFPRETARVLRPDGVVVWINTSGDGTPIHLPAADVLAALGPEWTGVDSEAGWGTWVVARRAQTDGRSRPSLT